MVEREKVTMTEYCHKLAEVLIRKYNFVTISDKKIDDIYKASTKLFVSGILLVI